MRIRLLSLLICGAACVASALQPPKSFHPGAIWQDGNGVPINAHGGGILLYGKTWYWFGEHKVPGEAGNRAQVGVHVYSSRNLYDWKDEGIALAVSDDPRSEIVRDSIIERPKVLYNRRTGKFVMWFHLELKGQGYRAARSGVALADRVTGPYRYLESFRPNAGVWPLNVTEADREPEARNFLARDFEVGQMARDMTLFADEDGKAYQIYASEENHTLHVSLLSDDYLRPAGRYVRIFPWGDNEAPAIFKRHGRYYLLTSGLSGWKPNAARSAVADSIWGPWRPLGNPVRGTPEECAVTFGSQSTFVLPLPGKKDVFIFMADRWRPENAIDGRYVWLPIQFEQDTPVLRWSAEWDLSFFKPPTRSHL